MAIAAVEADARPRAAPTHLRFALFDSLRAIAALSVVVYHVAGWSGVNLFAWYGAFTSTMNAGVTLFFLISGFLLYRPHAVAMFGGPAPPPVGDYALRRAFRILPAYWVALTLLGLWPGLAGVFSRHWWAYYGLLQSYRSVWSTRGLGVAWSLSVELAYYALLPLIAWGLVVLGRRRDARGRLRLQLFAFAALGAACLAFRVAIHRANQVDLFTTLPANFLGFAVGMAMAVVSAWLEGRERAWRSTRWVVDKPGWCWALAAAIFVATSLSPAFPRPFSGLPQSTAAYTVEAVLYCAMAFFLMLPGVYGEHAGGLPRRILRSRSLSWVGKVSYGIFLWHLPLVRTAQEQAPHEPSLLLAFVRLGLVIVPLSILLGWLSWRLVELPALRAARLLGARGILGAMATEQRGPSTHGSP